jgi:hypothetical protein
METKSLCGCFHDLILENKRRIKRLRDNKPFLGVAKGEVLC